MNKRVLIVLTQPLDPTTGGVQMSTVKMARMLASQGHKVAVYSFEHSGHVKCSEGRLYTAPNNGNVDNYANHLALKRCLSDFSPDVVINQMSYEHTITETIKSASTAFRIGCLRNTLYSVRNNLDQYGRRLLPHNISPLARNPVGRAALLAFHRRRHARDLRRILASYDRFVMFAEPNLEELAYFVPDYDRARIVLIPNSIESVAETMPVKDRRILWLGRVSEQQKRADLILPLWRKLHAELPDWSFDVVGDGPLLPSLREQAVHERTPRLGFHGRQQSTPFFIQSAIYLMTSDFEGFPNTLVEAQSHGAVPVVFDTYPVARVLIHDGSNGRMIAPGDINGMADAIIELCSDEDARQKMAHSALESARRFEEPIVANHWKQLLDSVTG